MTRTLLIAAAALTLAACASAPEPMGAPTSEVRAPVGEASQANWDAGNAAYLAWNAGRPVLNGWCSIGSPFVAEAMASAGWDTVTLDVQHGFMGYAEMAAMLQAVTASGGRPSMPVDAA